jgi:hypothetical protein
LPHLFVESESGLLLNEDHFTEVLGYQYSDSSPPEQMVTVVSSLTPPGLMGIDAEKSDRRPCNASLFAKQKLKFHTPPALISPKLKSSSGHCSITIIYISSINDRQLLCIYIYDVTYIYIYTI